MEVKVERRIKRLYMHMGLLSMMLKGAPKAYTTNAPEDMVILAIKQTPDMVVEGVFECVVHSPSFEEIPEGEDVPVMDPLEFSEPERIVLLK